MIDNELKYYIESEILPRYEWFDAAHRLDHAETVISESMALAEHYDVDWSMVYVINFFCVLFISFFSSFNGITLITVKACNHK